jgi:uncharacterized protein YkuJ
MLHLSHIGVAAGLALIVPTGELERIDEVMAKEKFTISIECLDLGYFRNKQWYRFDRSDSTLRVTHEHLILNYQDSTLNDTPLRSEALWRIANLLKGLKRTEIESPKKVMKQMDRNGSPVIIELYSVQDTIIMFDPENKALPALMGILSTHKE